MQKEKRNNPLTKTGFIKLADEHSHLMNHVRPQVVEAIATAAAEGDRSENAEYIYGKKRLREVDRRLRYLDRLLKDAKVVDTSLLQGSKVGFGATVTVILDDGEEQRKTWTLVGEGETDHHSGRIDWKSPMARAIIGKIAGDSVVALRPKGPVTVTIVEVTFE